MTKAKNRRQRKASRQYGKPSAPRVIGANDNAASANDNEIRAMERSAQKRDAKEQAARLAGQGVEVTLAGDRIVAAKRVGGLEWLRRKERITLNQYRAGEQYGDDFAKADEPVIRSCLNDHVGGEPEPMQETKRAASARLQAARLGALNGHEKMIDLLDAVCGRGARVRTLAGGDDAMANRLEAQLLIGLDLLASYYGYDRLPK